MSHKTCPPEIAAILARYEAAGVRQISSSEPARSTWPVECQTDPACSREVEPFDVKGAATAWARNHALATYHVVRVEQIKRRTIVLIGREPST